MQAKLDEVRRQMDDKKHGMLRSKLPSLATRLRAKRKAATRRLAFRTRSDSPEKAKKRAGCVRGLACEHDEDEESWNAWETTSLSSDYGLCSDTTTVSATAGQGASIPELPFVECEHLTTMPYGCMHETSCAAEIWFTPWVKGTIGGTIFQESNDPGAPVGLVSRGCLEGSVGIELAGLPIPLIEGKIEGCVASGKSNCQEPTSYLHLPEYHRWNSPAFDANQFLDFKKWVMLWANSLQVNKDKEIAMGGANGAWNRDAHFWPSCMANTPNEPEFSEKPALNERFCPGGPYNSFNNGWPMCEWGHSWSANCVNGEQTPADGALAALTQWQVVNWRMYEKPVVDVAYATAEYGLTHLSFGFTLTVLILGVELKWDVYDYWFAPYRSFPVYAGTSWGDAVFESDMPYYPPCARQRPGVIDGRQHPMTLSLAVQLCAIFVCVDIWEGRLIP